jgi:hypothetical protein
VQEDSDAQDLREPDDTSKVLGSASAGLKAATNSTKTVSPGESIAKLFEEMNTYRDILLGMLNFCDVQRTTEELEEEVARLEKHESCVYNCASLCVMLERAGALAQVDSGVELEPERVTVDGVEYLRAAKRPPRRWRTTDAGMEYASQDDPETRLRELLDEEPQYAQVYAYVLQICQQQDGSSVQEIGDAVNGLDVLQNPRMYAAHFIERLFKGGALSWDGAWHTTDLGMHALNTLDPESSQK